MRQSIRKYKEFKIETEKNMSISEITIIIDQIPSLKGDKTWRKQIGQNHKKQAQRVLEP